MPPKEMTISQYVKALPDDRRPAFKKLRAVIKANIPEGFKEQMIYGMPGFVVPKSIYPAGYHTAKGGPLPFINYANQKANIALYHSGIYADPKVLEWFQKEYAKHVDHKLDMGKCCIRFKRVDDIPFDLIGKLAKKFTVKKWIKIYENALR